MNDWLFLVGVSSVYRLGESCFPECAVYIRQWVSLVLHAGIFSQDLVFGRIFSIRWALIRVTFVVTVSVSFRIARNLFVFLPLILVPVLDGVSV